jgi:hypothetical protein
VSDDVKPENIQTMVDFLRSFDQARGHFAESYRHALLGTAETMRVFQQVAGDPRIAPYGAPFESLLDLLRRGMAIWAEKIPALLEASTLDTARREALLTVKEVLLAELQRTAEDGVDSPQASAKTEALEALVKVVDLELARREEKTNEPMAETMRRVVIE